MGPRRSTRAKVPDVSADADPDSGYVVYNDGFWQSIGGTSGAAPLWAAAAALIDSSPFCSDYDVGDVGGLPQGLYTVARSGPSLLACFQRHHNRGQRLPALWLLSRPVPGDHRL